MGSLAGDGAGVGEADRRPIVQIDIKAVDSPETDKCTAVLSKWAIATVRGLDACDVRHPRVRLTRRPMCAGR